MDRTQITNSIPIVVCVLLSNIIFMQKIMSKDYNYSVLTCFLSHVTISVKHLISIIQGKI